MQGHLIHSLLPDEDFSLTGSKGAQKAHPTDAQEYLVLTDVPNFHPENTAGDVDLAVTVVLKILPASAAAEDRVLSGIIEVKKFLLAAAAEDFALAGAALQALSATEAQYLTLSESFGFQKIPETVAETFALG